MDGLPDATARGSYTPATIHEAKLGLVSLQEPASGGGAATAGSVAAPEEMAIPGSLYYPADRTQPRPSSCSCTATTGRATRARTPRS